MKSGSGEKSSSKQKKRFSFFVLFLTSLLIVFAFGYGLGNKAYITKPQGVTNADNGKPEDVDFSLFWEAWNKFKNKSVYDVGPQKMLEGAISGVLSSAGDPYTTYFTKKENDRFLEDIQGEFGGVGVEITLKDGLPTIVAPLSDTPAEKAGVKAGDIILEVDGADTSEIGFEETINRIRGDEGTDVKLKILRESEEDPIEITITRSKIVVKSVEYKIENYKGKKIAVVEIRQFGDDTEVLFNHAAEEIVKENPDGIVLDLRNDPGGYLETAVNIASYFIEDGVVVSEVGKNNDKKDYNAKGSAKLKGYKTVILVNGGTASASEILTGALRDRNESKIIGEKTFGKGSVQELIELSNGSAVKITVAKWFTPNGDQINGEGIKPDEKIDDDEKTPVDEQLDKALEAIAG